MSHESLPVTGNRLPVANPIRVWGCARLVTFGLLALLLMASGPGLLPRVSAVITIAGERPDAITGDPEVFFAVSLVVVSTISWVMGAILGVRALLAGVRAMLSLFVPVRAPEGIEDAVGVLRQLFQDRVISTYSAPSGLVRRAIHVISSRLTYTTPPQRRLVERLIGPAFCWAFWLALLSLPRFVPVRLLDPDAEPGVSKNLPIGAGWALPVGLAAAGLLVFATRLIAVLVSMPREPRVEVHESRDHHENTGNPLNFFSHLLRSLESMRRGTFPNRNLLLSEPEVGRTMQGETNRFAACVLVETQPWPVARGLPAGAVVLDLGAIGLTCMGFAFLAFLHTRLKPDLTMADLVAAGMQFIAGIAAWRAAADLSRTARTLYSTFRFQSDVFWCEFKGTYTASSVGIGDGRGGQLYSERVAIQSDTDAHIYSSRLITECSGLTAERYLCDTRADDELMAAVNQLREAMSSFDDSGSRLAGVDLGSANLHRIVQANAQIASMSPAPATGYLPSSEPMRLPGLPDGTAATAGGADTKVCPECGETVKAGARKCRFCGWRFDQEQQRGLDHGETGGGIGG